ncbi:hypothetical protein DsansV1_C33g0224391 [Dioscorea sansibarensis]
MCDLVARTGRHQQRYQDGYRLISGLFWFVIWEFDCSQMFCL